MKYRAAAFVRPKDGGVIRHPLGEFATSAEADNAIENAVRAFADDARWDGPEGTSRLLVRPDYGERPIAFPAITRPGLWSDEAANDAC